MFFTVFGAVAAQHAIRLEKFKTAETALMQFAKKFGNVDDSMYNMTFIDTLIPSAKVPLKGLNEESLIIHGVRLDSLQPNHDSHKNGQRPAHHHLSEYPLVLVHGYMNGALYYYRNLVGLTKYFHTIYSLDLLGWGRSSRPTFTPLDNSVRATEDVFVESLEEWRKAQQIEKMVLAGHSMGGYLSVAYCERYPERVDRLILLSPVGIPDDDKKDTRQSSWGRRFLSSLFHLDVTPCSIVRSLPESQGKRYIEQYVEKRLPAIQDVAERNALTDYLYYNAAMPGSGEYALRRLLTPYAFARDPMVHRIPKLKISNVSFLYGDVDWMDAGGGLQVQQSKSMHQAVQVYQVPNAGHLLMLDNWKHFEAALVMAVSGKNLEGPRLLQRTKDVNEVESLKSMASPPLEVNISNEQNVA